MKKEKFGLSAAVWMLSAFFMLTNACTNIIVGKAASADGSVIVSYNADSYGMFGDIYHHVGASHQKGEMRKVHNWDTNKYLGEIPQADITYTVVGQMNANQVSITETTFGGREELWKTEGMLDYGSLIYIALERATSARNAIDIITSLVQQYGYCSEGETFSICDKNEAWVLEMIGKGAGEKGAVWAAVRIPDDCVSAHANQSRITRLSQYDKKQVLCSKDVITFARQKGYFTGKDKDFSFRDAYAPNDFTAVRYCEARVWSIFNRFCDGMDQYVEYAKGNDLQGQMPLYLKPNRKISVKDVMNGMRDHYEGTPFDIQNQLGAGPYNMPYRPTPLSWKDADQAFFNERPVSTQQTAFSFVGQMRSQYPDVVGGIVWVTNDDPNMTPYIPLHCSITQMPSCFRKIEGKQDDVTFSWQSAFWLQNAVSNMVYPYYEKMFPDLLRVRNEVEASAGEMAQLTDQPLTLVKEKSVEEAIRYETETAQQRAGMMMQRWTELYQYLMVKHLDMATKKVDESASLLQSFKKTPNGLAEPPARPGYPEAYRKRIQAEAGDRYLMK